MRLFNQRNKYFYILGFLLLFISAPNFAETLDKIVAVVNSDVITQLQLNAQINSFQQQLSLSHQPIPSPAVLRAQVLNHLIDSKLQLQFAQTAGIKIDDATVDNAISSIAAQNNLSVMQIKEQLKLRNINYENYREDIRNQIAITQLENDQLGSQIKVTEQEITNQLKNTPSISVEKNNASYHVEDLLISLPSSPSSVVITQAKQRAIQLLQQAHSGKTFQQLVVASRNDIDPLSGSDLGERTLDQLPKIFSTALQQHIPGDYVGPIVAPNGIHILHIFSVKQSDSAPNAISSALLKQIVIKTTPLVTDAEAHQRLREIRAQIIRGGKFEELAEEYSQDPNTASEGGNLGWVLSMNVEPEFQQQINKLSINEISLPFKRQSTWVIIQLLGRKKINTTDQAFSRATAQQVVYQRKREEALKIWLLQLRQQSYVKIFN